jgi:uncharacterized protein
MLRLFGLLVLALPAQAASFDCAKASTKVEHMICDNAELSKLDEDLSAKYRIVVKDQIKLKALDISQKQWLEYRDRCDREICIRNYYKQRAFELDFIIRGLKTSKEISRYVIKEEMNGGEPVPEEDKDSETIRGEAFCKVVLDRLNNTHPSHYERPCIADEVLQLPGVTNPAWARLDLVAHEDLAKKIVTLGLVDVQNYLKLPPPEQQNNALNYVKQRNLEAYTFQLAPQFFGDRKLLTLIYRDDRCGAPISKIGAGSYAAWVSSDLKEIANGSGVFNPKAGRPFMYQGQLYFMQVYGTGEALTIYVPAKEFLSKVCDINLVSENANQ